MKTRQILDGRHRETAWRCARMFEEENVAHRVLLSMILFLQDRGMYDEYLRWRLQARRMSARRLRNEEALLWLRNSDESTDEESSETESSESV